MINVRLSRYIVLFSLLLSVELNAQTEISISTNFQYFAYEEFSLDDKSLNKETGILPGLQATLGFHQDTLIHYLFANIYAADVDYDGQLQNGSPHRTKTSTTLINLAYRLKSSVLTNNFFIHSQINWDYWSRSIQKTSLVSGLDEIYRWPSIDLGLSYSMIKNKKHEFLVEAAYTKIFKGHFEVDLSANGFGVQALKLGQGKGFKSTLSYRYKLNKTLTSHINIFYKSWGFSRSKSKTASNGTTVINFVEPRSESKRIGLTFMLSYLF